MLAAAPESFPIFQWHDDTFTLPEGAMRLAENDVAGNQAFRIGRAAYGVQFHFEADRALVRHWNEAFADYLTEHQPGWAEAATMRRRCMARRPMRPAWRWPEPGSPRSEPAPILAPRRKAGEERNRERRGVAELRVPRPYDVGERWLGATPETERGSEGRARYPWLPCGKARAKPRRMGASLPLRQRSALHKPHTSRPLHIWHGVFLSLRQCLVGAGFGPAGGLDERRWVRI